MHFRLIWAHFPKFEQNEIFRRCESRPVIPHVTFSFRAFPAKINDPIFRKGPFGTQIPKFGTNEQFPQKSGYATFLRLRSTNFM